MVSPSEQSIAYEAMTNIARLTRLTDYHASEKGNSRINYAPLDKPYSLRIQREAPLMQEKEKDRDDYMTLLHSYSRN